MTARIFPHSVSAAVDPRTEPNLGRDPDGNPQVTIPFPGGSSYTANALDDLAGLKRLVVTAERMLRGALAAQAGKDPR